MIREGQSTVSFGPLGPDVIDKGVGGLSFDTPVPYHSFSKYWNPNLTDTDMNLAWDSIDTNAMAVALHDDYSKNLDLFPSTRFPWDTERSVYYVKGIHDLHCLVRLHSSRFDNLLLTILPRNSSVKPLPPNMTTVVRPLI